MAKKKTTSARTLVETTIAVRDIEPAQHALKQLLQGKTDTDVALNYARLARVLDNEQATVAQQKLALRDRYGEPVTDMVLSLKKEQREALAAILEGSSAEAASELLALVRQAKAVPTGAYVIPAEGWQEYDQGIKALDEAEITVQSPQVRASDLGKQVDGVVAYGLLPFIEV